ncbi:MAG: hypothetical protein ACE5JD_15415 [Candidatus Methylomirabilia bacterium]
MINVNKLFRRLSIRAKLVIAFCLLGVVPVTVVGGYGALQSFFLLNDAIQDRLRVGVALKAEQIQRFLRNIEGDVGFLSRLPTLQALINLAPGARDQRQNLLNRLVLLCHKTSTGPRHMPTRGTREVFKQGAGEELIDRGNRGGHMAFRPYRARPAG